MVKVKIKKLNNRIPKVINGLILIITLSLFPFFSLNATDNSDFTVATTTANVVIGNNTQSTTVEESVANVSIGEDTQTNTAETTVANVSEVKASTTLTVGSLPLDTETITIGTCVITFTTTPGVTSDQLDCGSHTATIDTNKDAGDVDRTAPEIATVISTVTDVADTVHGALSAALNGNSVTFTTAGTETSATEITFTDGTTSKIIDTASNAGVLPVAQVSTITPANIETGDIFTVIINGTTISFTATFNTVANVTAGLTAAINDSSQAANVTAADQGTRVDVTSDTAGTAFTIASGTSNRTNTVAQISTVTPVNVETGDTFNVTINGNTISYTATDSTVAGVTAGLTAAINSSVQATNVTATDHAVRLDVTADVSGEPFTITGGTANRPPVAQVSTVTPVTVKQEETVYVKINGVSYYYIIKVGDAVADVITGLKAAITSSDVTVSGTDNITLTAVTAGTAFTVEAGFSEVTLSSTYGVIRDEVQIGNLSGNLRIGDITTSSAKIIWNTDSAAPGTLYITKSKSKLRRSNLPSSLLQFTDSNSTISHGFIVSGLKRNAKHYFIVVSGDSRSKIFSFKTKHPWRLIY